MVAPAWINQRPGFVPPSAQTLIDVHRLRVASLPYGVQKVDAAPGVVTITFRPNPPIDQLDIVRLIQQNRHIKLASNDKLRIERALPQAQQRALLERDTLKALKLKTSA